MRMTSKKPALALTLLLFCPAIGRADSLLLKSGEVLRGSVVAKNESSYTFRQASGETVEVPFMRVDIADIDPTSVVGSKSSFTVMSKTEPSADAAPTERAPKPMPLPVASNSPASGIAEMTGHGNVLKNAEETVALSNARTAEVQKNLEEMKKIADAANGRT